jgi:integrase
MSNVLPKALTAAAIERQKSNPHRRLEIPDGRLPGLYLIVQPSGAKSWAVRYRHGGKSRKLTMASYPAVDLKEARDAARSAMQRVQKGGDPAKEKKFERRRAADNADTFAAVALNFIVKYQAPKNRSWKGTARLLGYVPDPGKPAATDDPETYVALSGSLVSKSRWGERKISDIRRFEVIAALEDVTKLGSAKTRPGATRRGAPIAANRLLSALRKLFNWALERDLTATTPCAGVKALAPEQSRDRWLNDGELRAVWRASVKAGWPFGPVLQLLILTGQRRDEVAGMRWSELDFEARQWSLPRGRVKNNSGHDVPLSDAAFDILKAVVPIEGSDFVFTTTGTTPISGFSKIKARIDAAVEFDDWRMHDLRRTVASGMGDLRIALPVIEKVLNHVSGSFRGIVGVYHRNKFADEKRHALDAWAAHVMRIVMVQPDNVISLRVK